MAEFTRKTEKSTRLLEGGEGFQNVDIKHRSQVFSGLILPIRDLISTKLSSFSTIRMALITLSLFVALFALAGKLTTADSARECAYLAAQCTTTAFSTVLPAGASIEKVASVPNNGNYGEGAADKGYPTNATGLPQLCAVTVKVQSSSSSTYRFGLFLPTTSNWSSRFLAVGNGAFLGGINWQSMGAGAHYNMATVSTDTGHNSGTGDLSWALKAPEQQTDWGWRALHGSIQIAKQLTEAYYGKPINKSYYSGCSTGGRQGLKEIQISPGSFDGVLIGSAAWDTRHLMPWVTKLGILNLPEGDPKDFTTIDQFKLLADTTLRQCDRADGIVDNIISSPENCNPDFTQIQCGQPGVDPSNCLSLQQIQTTKKIYSDYYTDGGKFVHNGQQIGSENQWDTFILYGNAAGFDTAYEKYFLYDDPNWNWTQYNDSVVEFSEQKNPGNATADQYDISTFKQRGGKVIMYHGQADAVVPTRSSILYYNRTMQAMGNNLQDFFRFFLVPGMQHCWSSPPGVNAPWMFAGSGQAIQIPNGNGWTVPGFADAKHDALLALVNWVENGTAIDSIIATAWTSSNAVYRQRPLCPYPKMAKYNGSGDQNIASSWTCQ